MKHIFRCITFLIFVNAIAQEDANRTITFFIEQYPELQQKIPSKNEAYEFCSLVNCKDLNFSSVFGIFSTYAGYLALSNDVGQVTFPRKTVKDSINLLITSKILPVFMFQNTIAYWEIEKDIPAKMYKFEKKQDEDTGLFYWDTTEKKISAKRQIPLHTIIIFAEADSIYVSLGVTISNSSPQLVLPTIFVKRDPNYMQNVLFILKIKPFFSQINKIFKERPLGYATYII